MKNFEAVEVKAMEKERGGIQFLLYALGLPYTGPVAAVAAVVVGVAVLGSLAYGIYEGMTGGQE